MSEGWSLTESDPAIFSAILHDVGVSGVQVEELWSLDSQSLDDLDPVHALIFLFKWVASHGSEEGGQAGTPDPGPEGTWFAHQVINNACATLALLNATLNIPTTATDRSPGPPTFSLGKDLEELKSFSAGLDPRLRGEVITNAEKVREVHNSFARSDPFHLDEASEKSSEDAYHFITYLPIGGSLFELDGLKPLPVSHGPIPEGKPWTEVARRVVKDRIALYPPEELHFNLMAICGDRLDSLQHRISTLRARPRGPSSAAADDGELAGLGEKLVAEREKRDRWDFDNKNHVGLAHAMLVELAKAGRLDGQVARAQAAMAGRKAKRRARGPGPAGSSADHDDDDDGEDGG